MAAIRVRSDVLVGNIISKYCISAEKSLDPQFSDKPPHCMHPTRSGQAHYLAAYKSLALLLHMMRYPFLNARDKVAYQSLIIPDDQSLVDDDSEDDDGIPGLTASPQIEVEFPRCCDAAADAGAMRSCATSKMTGAITPRQH